MLEMLPFSIMNFAELQKLIENLKQLLPCPSCKSRLQVEGIHVLATLPETGLFIIHCHQCGMTGFLNAFFSYQGKNKEKYLNVRIEKPDFISANDVIDVHNVLKNFGGDFRKLFNREKS